MFAKKVTRNKNSSEGSGDLAIHLSPIPYPLSPIISLSTVATVQFMEASLITNN